jgi:hypothetical protein
MNSAAVIAAWVASFFAHAFDPALLAGFWFVMHMIMVMSVGPVDAIAIIVAVLPRVAFVLIAPAETYGGGNN